MACALRLNRVICAARGDLRNARASMMSQHVRERLEVAPTPLPGPRALAGNVHVARGPRDSGPGNVRGDFYGGAMTNSDYPWEPPLAGTEAEQLAGALGRLRATFRWKADDLDAAGLQTRIGASTLTLGGLLKHLAFVEDYTFTYKLR
jgi:Protein of unknown function (DUF664)